MKNAFTLIELLAVIVILAVIAAITTPIVLNVIQTSRENAFIDTSYGIISAAREYQIRQSNENKEMDLIIDFTKNKNTSTLTLNGDLPDGGTFHINEDGKTELRLWSDSAEVCVTKDLNDKEVKVNESLDSKDKCYKDFS